MPMMRDLTRRYLPRFIAQKMAMTTQRFVYPPDLTDADVRLTEWAGPYTMTSPERIAALAEAVRYVVAHEIPGAIVECGVWRGGSMMVAGRVLADLGVTDRELVLCDTFAGMTPPTAADRDVYGTTAEAALKAVPKQEGARNLWCLASREDVATNLARSSYPLSRARFVVGRVEDTLPAQAPAEIALLRLDTDWYESTRHELEALWDRVSPGGVLIVDDYGHWSGARRAVDEFFAANGPAPLLHRIDYTGRMAIKPPHG